MMQTSAIVLRPWMAPAFLFKNSNTSNNFL